MVPRIAQIRTQFLTKQQRVPPAVTALDAFLYKTECRTNNCKWHQQLPRAVLDNSGARLVLLVQLVLQCNARQVIKQWHVKCATPPREPRE